MHTQTVLLSPLTFCQHTQRGAVCAIIIHILAELTLGAKVRRPCLIAVQRRNCVNSDQQHLHQVCANIIWIHFYLWIVQLFSKLFDHIDVLKL